MRNNEQRACPDCAAWMHLRSTRCRRCYLDKRRADAETLEAVARRQERARDYNREYNRTYLKERRAADSTVRRRERNLKLRQYGITVDQFDAMLARQGGGCAICGNKNAGGRWGRFVVDHCHSTNNVRGLLCHHCNLVIGQAKDDASLLTKAARYLMEAQGFVVADQR